QLQCVQRGRENDNGGAVLVVVEHGNVEFFLETVFDLETARRADVFEVDAAEPGGNPFYGPDDFLRVLRLETDRIGIDVTKFLEEHRLAFHDGHGALGPDVAQAEHGRTIADDGDGVMFNRQRTGL